LVIFHVTSSMLPPNDVKGLFTEGVKEMVTTSKPWKAVRIRASVHARTTSVLFLAQGVK